MIEIFTFNPFAENTYIIYDNTKECIIIDPGCIEQAEQDELKNFISSNELVPKRLINTHCHVDHVFGNNFVSDTYNLGLEMHKDDIGLLKSAEQVGSMYGFNVDQPRDPEKFFNEGDTIDFGKTSLKILHTPGHSPGHVVLVNEREKYIIAGDVLFQGSIGRSDLPGGDHETLIKSIKEKLLILGDEYKVYPGHGPSTTIEFERQHNPFLQ